MDKSVGAIRKDGPSSKPYCLHFSDGRKECFKSEKQAEKREKQVNFFKHRDKASKDMSGDEKYAIAILGITSIYNKDNSDETIFVVNEEGINEIYLIRKASDSEENEIFKLDENFKDISDYSEVLDYISKNSYPIVIKANTNINLSEAVVENQLIKGSHTHTIDTTNIDTSNGYATVQTSDSDGHTHWVDISSNGYYYVSSAPIDIGGVKISHTHLIVVGE